MGMWPKTEMITYSGVELHEYFELLTQTLWIGPRWVAAVEIEILLIERLYSRLGGSCLEPLDGPV